MGAFCLDCAECIHFVSCIILPRLGNELGKAASPRFASEAGDAPEEPRFAPKGKGKSKAKKTGT